MKDKRPMPKVNSDNRPFWNGCRGHELRFQKCGTCGRVRWPPSGICPACHSDSTGWIVSGGRGRVFSFAVYRTAFHPGFQDAVPYVVALVELDEGPLMISNIIDCTPEDVTCDMTVEVTWEDISEEFSLPKFRPAAPEGGIDPREAVPADQV